MHRSAVAYCVRADARRNWPAWLAVGLLLGIAVGSVVAAAAGARRTDSAFRRLVTETHAISGGILFRCDVRADPSCAPSTEEVLAWPGVADAAPLVTAHVPIVTADGAVVQINGDACGTGSGEVTLLVPVDGRFGTELNEVRILEGRVADPTRADEVVLAPIAAEEHGVEVGDVLSVYLGRDVDCENPDSWIGPTELTVVGIGMSAAEVPPKAGDYFQGLHATPAFAESQPPNPEQFMTVRLDPGTDFQQLSEAPGVTPFDVAFDLEALGQPIDDGLRADANALWLVALFGGIGALFVVGPVLARYAALTAEVDAGLAPVGWSRRDRVARAATHGAVIGILAVVVTGVVALVASTRTPIGDARVMEPNPGMELDPLPFSLGVLAALAAASIGLATLAARRSRPSTGRRTPLARLAAAAGFPSTVVFGLRVGLEPGRRQAPVRSSLFAVTVGVVAVVGSLVYTSGAQHLGETPRLAGITWEDFVYISDRPDGTAIAERARDWPEVEAVGVLGFFTRPVLLGEDQVPGRILAFGAGPGAIEPAVIDGRAPAGSAEILLSPKLADTLDLGVGDQVSGSFEVGEEGDPEQTLSESRDYEVVGIGPVPIAGGNFDIGASMTIDGYLQALPPPPEDEPLSASDFLVIDRAPGVEDDAIRARLAAEDLEVFGELGTAEDLLRDLVTIDITSTESAPDLLALLMVIMAGGVLAYALAATINRNGHDLAIARALGFAPRQVRRTSAWAATSFTAAALLAGVPLGLVAGRAAWRTYAESLGVIPTPVVPWMEIVAFVGAALVAANLVAAIAAWNLSRTRPAEPLRAE